jgi:pyruvate kinase
MAEISCSLDAIFLAANVGERVVFDDGKFTGCVEEVEADRILVRLVDAPRDGGKLRAEKGINLPETELDCPLISESDLPLLEFAAHRADMLAVSFLRRGDDVTSVQAELARLGTPDLALVLKIETQAGFTNLPAILLEAMRSPHVGVMIARGDLAVEMGYPRLAEVQEEILWLAEAAHLPVIWATEVLDRLTTTGRPSRAEVTDAAMAQRAECVMLNKGPYIALAIAELDDIMRRMARHQRKTTPLLRPLTSWADY